MLDNKDMCKSYFLPPVKKQPIKIIKVFLLMFPLVLAAIIASSPSLFAQQRANKKLFLFASELPKTLIDQHYVIRKHVVDVILATQKYDLVFSEIPDRLAKSDVSQLILKYKIRTNDDDKFDLEFTYIDADQVSVSKTEVFENIPPRKFLYDFRLHLYEFVLDKKLTFSEMVKYSKKSKSKIEKINKSTIRKVGPKPTFPEISSTPENKNVNTNPNNKNKKRNIKAKVRKSKPQPEKLSLWALLKDTDRDRTWLEKKEDKAKEEKKNKSKDVKRAVVKPFVNPFLNIGSISLKTDDEFNIDLGTDQFHFGWKFVHRKLNIDDLIELTNEFDSLLGTTFEWIIYQPIHVSRYFLRAGFEIDKALNTTPIDMNDHFLFRVGLGYRLPNRLLPTVYYERSSLVYANLNNVGEGLVSNSQTVNWLNFELAYLGLKSYVSIHLAKSAYISKLGDTREASSATGFRYGYNLRYFFSTKVFGLKWWGDFEYRKGIYSRENIDTELELSKQEYSFRVGIHF
jgi:hypothetical protein